MAKRIFYLCFLPLLIGALVYIFFRRTGIIGISIHIFDIGRTAFWRVVVDTLPDFCWAFSFSNALYILFYHVGLSFWKGTAFILVAMCGSELVQIMLPQYFTFDIADLVAEVFAVFLSSVYFHRKLYENNAF